MAERPCTDVVQRSTIVDLMSDLDSGDSSDSGDGEDFASGSEPMTVRLSEIMTMIWKERLSVRSLIQVLEELRDVTGDSVVLLGHDGSTLYRIDA